MENKINWEEEMNIWKSGGLSQSEFCRRRNIGVAAFRYHLSRKKAAVTVPPKEFVEISGGAKNRSGLLKLEIDSNGEILIRVSSPNS